MNKIESLLAVLRSPSGGVVADMQIIDAAREAADEIENLQAFIDDAFEMHSNLDLDVDRVRALRAS